MKQKDTYTSPSWQDIFNELKLKLLGSNLINQDYLHTNIVIYKEDGLKEIDLSPYISDYKKLLSEVSPLLSNYDYILSEVEGVGGLCEVLKDIHKQQLQQINSSKSELPNVQVQLFSKLFGHDVKGLPILHYIYSEAFEEWMTLLFDGKLLKNYIEPMELAEGELRYDIRVLGERTYEAIYPKGHESQLQQQQQQEIQLMGEIQEQQSDLESDDQQ